MSAFATTPQLSAAASIPRTLDTLSSSLRGMLLVHVHSLGHIRPMRLFHSHASICSSPAKFLIVVLRLLDVLVDDEPHSKRLAVVDSCTVLDVMFIELATRLAFPFAASVAC